MVQKDRLFGRLMALGEVGKTEQGGVTRLGYTQEENDAHRTVAAYMEETGLDVRTDDAGNLIGRLDGDKSASTILVGSHLDSVRNGGRFDGALGVLAAVEALQSIREQGVSLMRPVEVVAFRDEEGSRFAFGMTGSRAVTGRIVTQDLDHRDREGLSIGEALAANGLKPERLLGAKREEGSLYAYLELHIEQGEVLEHRNLPVGIVTGIAGPLSLRFDLRGFAAHAGATPMGLRRDAGVAAAAVVQEIERIATRSGTSVATVGEMALLPGSANVIPGEAVLSLDLRDADEGRRDAVEAQILEAARRITDERRIEFAVEEIERITPVLCAPRLVALLSQCAQGVGLEAHEMPSGAGHDAMQFAEICPVGMVFVRSQGGVSHNPAEFSSPEDCADGARVLERAILALSLEGN